MPIDVQAGDSVLFTQAPGHWNRDRVYRVTAATNDGITVECDGHYYNIAKSDFERLGLTEASKE